MKNSGGYQIVNLETEDAFTKGVAKTIDGIYEVIEGTDKALLVTGLTVGSTEYDDFFSYAKIVSGDFIIEGYGLKIKIDDDDKVTVSDADAAYTLPEATTTTLGGVRMMAQVTPGSQWTTVAEAYTKFQALLTALNDAGIMRSE